MYECWDLGCKAPLTKIQRCPTSDHAFLVSEHGLARQQEISLVLAKAPSIHY